MHLKFALSRFVQLEAVYLEALLYVDFGFWFGYQGTIKLWVPHFRCHVG